VPEQAIPAEHSARGVLRVRRRRAVRMGDEPVERLWGADCRRLAENRRLLCAARHVYSRRRRTEARRGRVPRRDGALPAALVSRIPRRAAHLPYGYRADDRRGYHTRRPEQLRRQYYLRTADCRGIVEGRDRREARPVADGGLRRVIVFVHSADWIAGV